MNDLYANGKKPVVKEVVEAWEKRLTDGSGSTWFGGKDRIKGKTGELNSEKQEEAFFWEREVELNDL